MQKPNVAENVVPLHEGSSLTEQIAAMPKNSSYEDIRLIIEAISSLESETHQDLYINQLHKKFGISAKSIRKDIEKICGTDEKHSKEEKVLYSASFPELVDLCLDDDGSAVYLGKDGTGELFIEKTWDKDGTIYSPPEKDYLPFILPRASSVVQWYREDNDEQLLEDVLSYLNRFSYLDAKQSLVLANAIFLSYIQDHPDIHYLAMITFYASPERGKSRTGKSMTYASHRGVHVVDLREPNLFRFSQDLKATIFFDLMDLWDKAKRNGSEDVLLLRFEKGAKVSRVLFPEKGPFQDMKHFDVSGLSYIATNKAVHNILDTRALNIIMPNKPGYYENPTPEKAIEIKERLTAWRARMMNSPLPDVAPHRGLQGRMWDISKPLLQICMAVHPGRYEMLQEAILDIAGQRIEDKKQGIEGQIVTIIEDLSSGHEDEWTVQTRDVLEKFNEGRPEDYRKTSQWLGKKLQGMGLKTRLLHGYSEIMLTKNEFDTLVGQFVFAPDEQEGWEHGD